MSYFTDRDNLRATLAEFLATFLLVFIGVGAIGAFTDVSNVAGPQILLIGVAHGLAVAVGVIAVGRVSGAHINPAVTVAALISGRIGLVRSGMYIVAQLGGAAVAMVALDGSAFQTNNLGLHAPGLNVTTGNAFVIEVVLTFFLVFVIFATALDKRNTTALAPLAIGGMIAMGHFVAIPLTGASMNPARSFGPALIHGEWADHWIYWAAPIAGAVIAAIVYVTIFGTANDRARAGAISLGEPES